jgi:dihydroorotate dehydrogenase
MYPFFRALLFRMEPEKAHALTLGLMRLAGALPPATAFLRRWFAAPPAPVEVFGLRFINPLGLAAGYDKDALGWRGLAALGFGHIEIGTVTPRPQPGNPPPRLFRLPDDRALINRMGFPGKGADFVARRLTAPRPANLVVGVNLGKNKDTSLDAALQDYLPLVKTFAPLADYLVINVSSPNTIGLRRLQARQALSELLLPLQAARREQETRLAKRVPLLVKLAPDLNDTELDDALDVIIHTGLDGVIAANTTISRPALTSQFAAESGGLSGAPLQPLSLRMVQAIRHRTQGKLPVIACGGIMNSADARRFLDAGASLLQIYTGLVYAGPTLIQSILRDLAHHAP